MKVRASVVMAVYNGEKYLEEQIGSIVPQLDASDELLISVDPCGDSSKEIALKFAARDARVRVMDGPGKGVIKNFEAALKCAQGRFVFLSDQDDVWLEGKMAAVLDELMREGVTAVVHNASVTDEMLQNIFGRFFEHGFHSGIVRNIVRNRYIGCCMAIRRGLLDIALPFPDDIPMHDQWLGLLAAKHGRVAYIDRSLMLYRRHADTVTGRSKAGALTRLKLRLCITKDLLLFDGRRAHGRD
jgi:glycosyltransferase involved in cell wall biosynthesis